jgi:uncharacterized protein YkwD
MKNQVIRCVGVATIAVTQLWCTTPILGQQPSEAMAEAGQVVERHKDRETARAQEREKAAWSLTNKEREARGLQALDWSPELAKAARSHAEDMSVDGYFSHFSYDRVGDRLVETSSPRQRLLSFSERACAENIAQGPDKPEEVVARWMESDGHRNNILAEDYRMCGIGFANGYWVQVFGR